LKQQCAFQTTLPIEIIEKILQYGKELLEKPIVLLEVVEETLAALHGKYKLVVATKGDLLDQRRKLHNSGLGYFHHIKVMSDKQVDYSTCLEDSETSRIFYDWKFIKIRYFASFSYWRTRCSYSLSYHGRKIDHEIVHENFMTYEKISTFKSTIKKHFLTKNLVLIIYS
jgi:putative hydrolase of the HAD superfamily